MQMLRDQACIVGVGETAYTRGSQKSVLRLVLELHGTPWLTLASPSTTLTGLCCLAALGSLGSASRHQQLCYSTYIQMGGASLVTALQSAAMTVAMGIAHLRPRALRLERLLRSARQSARDPTGRAAPTENAMSRAVRNFYAPYGALAPVQVLCLVSHVTGRSLARRTNRWAKWH